MATNPVQDRLTGNSRSDFIATHPASNPPATPPAAEYAIANDTCSTVKPADVPIWPKNAQEPPMPVVRKKIEATTKITAGKLADGALDPGSALVAPWGIALRKGRQIKAIVARAENAPPNPAVSSKYGNITIPAMVMSDITTNHSP